MLVQIDFLPEELKLTSYLWLSAPPPVPRRSVSHIVAQQGVLLAALLKAPQKPSPGVSSPAKSLYLSCTLPLRGAAEEKLWKEPWRP